MLSHNTLKREKFSLTIWYHLLFMGQKCYWFHILSTLPYITSNKQWCAFNIMTTLIIAFIVLVVTEILPLSLFISSLPPPPSSPPQSSLPLLQLFSSLIVYHHCHYFHSHRPTVFINKSITNIIITLWAWYDCTVWQLHNLIWYPCTFIVHLITTLIQPFSFTFMVVAW